MYYPINKIRRVQEHFDCEFFHKIIIIFYPPVPWFIKYMRKNVDILVESNILNWGINKYKPHSYTIEL